MHSEQVRKPMNSFFYYRKAMRSKIIDMFDVCKSNEVSKIAANWWKTESQEVKDYYGNLSKTAHAEHKMKYPSFDWQPWKSRPKSMQLSKAKPVKKTKSVLQVSTVQRLEKEMELPTPGYISPDVLISVSSVYGTQFQDKLPIWADLNYFSIEEFCNTNLEIPETLPLPQSPSETSASSEA